MQLPGWLITVFYFFAALYPLVLVHELGHFLVAKLHRIRVDEFGLGFPPRALKLFSAGGTDYTLNWLPLGGFVRLHGEDDPTEPGAFAAARPRARAAVLLAGPFANFALTVVLLGLVGAVWGVEQAVRPDALVRIGGVEEGSPAAAAGLAMDDVIVAIDGRPPASHAAAAAPDGSAAVQGLIDAASAAADRPLALTVVRGGGDVVSVEAPEGLALGPVDAAWSARAVAAAATAEDGASIGPHDIVLAPADVADGGREPVAGERLVVLDAPDTPLETLELTVTPQLDAASGRAKMGVAIGALSVSTPVPLWQAPWHGLTGTVGMLGMMIDGLASMVRGTEEVQVAGPVGIARLSRLAGESGWMTLLRFAAILSANLGLINLFPIPGLDGGRLLFVGLEAIRGARIEPTREAIVHALGIGFVLLLMLVITVMEVLNPMTFARP